MRSIDVVDKCYRIEEVGYVMLEFDIDVAESIAMKLSLFGDLTIDELAKSPIAEIEALSKALKRYPKPTFDVFKSPFTTLTRPKYISVKNVRNVTVKYNAPELDPPKRAKSKKKRGE